MSDDQRILQLLEEILESGRTAEEVCADHPRLLKEVRRRLRGVRNVSAQLDKLFPLSNAPSRKPGRKTATAHYRRAQTLAGANRLDEAITHLQKAISIDSNYSSAYGPLGEYLMARGRIKEALIVLQQAIALLPATDPTRPHFIQVLQDCNGLLARQGLTPERPEP